MTVRNGTPRQGLAARATAALRRLGFNATNGGNATPSARTTVLARARGTDAAASMVARAVKLKAGGRVARADQPGLARTTVVLVLGPDFKGLAGRVAAPKPPPPAPQADRRPPATCPPWDPRPC